MTDTSGGDAGGGRLRLDKWLWYARFVKTRGLATRLIAGGHVRIDGERVEKSHQTVRAGAVLTFPLGHHVRVIRVVALGTRRGPAPEAQALYEDLAPPSRESRMDLALRPGAREPGAGRPTKRERRQIDALIGEDAPSDDA